MAFNRLMPASNPTPARPWPLAASLEEAAAAEVRDMAATLIFAVNRLPGNDERPLLFVAPRTWTAEYGRPFSQGLAPQAASPILVSVRTFVEGLWVMEQALRSGAVAGAIGAIDGATLPQSRRLDFAAREGKAAGVLLRTRNEGLSAARRRWRISAAPGATAPFDARAPGPFRLRAELVRGRGEPPGVWMLEQDDETHRLRLADRLAGDGLVQISRAIAA